MPTRVVRYPAMVDLSPAGHDISNLPPVDLGLLAGVMSQLHKHLSQSRLPHRSATLPGLVPRPSLWHIRENRLHESLITLRTIRCPGDAEHHIVCLALNLLFDRCTCNADFHTYCSGRIHYFDGPRARHNTSQGIGAVTLAVL